MEFVRPTLWIAKSIPNFSTTSLLQNLSTIYGRKKNRLSIMYDYWLDLRSTNMDTNTGIGMKWQHDNFWKNKTRF